MTNPTDAMRAECERALDAWTRGHGPTLPGHGPSIVPGKCQRCDDFRAGFNVLAARVEAWCQRLETEREEDFVIRQMKCDLAADLRAALKETKP